MLGFDLGSLNEVFCCPLLLHAKLKSSILDEAQKIQFTLNLLLQIHQNNFVGSPKIGSKPGIFETVVLFLGPKYASRMYF